MAKSHLKLVAPTEVLRTVGLGFEPEADRENTQAVVLS
jgi:hypothetical protein